MKNKIVKISDISIANDLPLAVIAGSCVIESREQVLTLAAKLKEIAASCGMPFIYKSSFDKANRSSIDSYRGVGIEKGLQILSDVKRELKVPVLTDVHNEEQAARAAKFVDIIQVPAFLSRQTDLLISCAKTGIPVNIKKGQFLAPLDMKNVIEKCERSGTDKITLTERGFSFGYNNLVVDFRSIEIMKSFSYPVIFDATHSVQLPGAGGNKSGGNRDFVLPLSKAAAAVGIAAIFLETHENPDVALSDGANSVNLEQFEKILKTVKKIDTAVKNEK
ncbi:MAG: 3-deoxy-8-phosphooctulonate synthase [Elusimicrobiota bacterium]|jgi:2-dehydro-3-deoxyphosphooctonate aldolase (KDO 8-P synthase)|nr:3-deoxy-8-phosphooctulonate synthase [Elusimicrobiota bacterium]